MVRKTLLAFCAAVTLLPMMTPPAFTQEPASLPKIKLRPYHPPPHGITREAIRGLIARTMRARALGQRIAVDPVQVPHWFFDVISSRDGGEYIGVMVGGNALIAGASPSSVPVQIIPVIVNTVTLGTAVDPFTGTLVVSYYDGRWDPAQARVSNYLATSIDGGASFGKQVFVNQPKDSIEFRR